MTDSLGPPTTARKNGLHAGRTFIHEETGQQRTLKQAIIMAVPNGRLQSRYAPTPQDTIWREGKHASGPRGEEPRVRLSIADLKKKARWRVQHVQWGPTGDVSCAWTETHGGTEVTHDVVADAR
jgi:hypothetical protein